MSFFTILTLLTPQMPAVAQSWVWEWCCSTLRVPLASLCHTMLTVEIHKKPSFCSCFSIWPNMVHIPAWYYDRIQVWGSFSFGTTEPVISDCVLVASQHRGCITAGLLHSQVQRSPSPVVTGQATAKGIWGNPASNLGFLPCSLKSASASFHVSLPLSTEWEIMSNAPD